MELILILFGILTLIILFFRLIGTIMLFFLRFPIIFLLFILLLAFSKRKFKKSNNYYQREYIHNQNNQYYSNKYRYYCNVIGVEENFTKEDLKQKFREKTKLYHPDKNSENKEYYEEKYKEIVEAYEELSKKFK